MKQILRFWVKDKWVTIINIAGLTLALTSCLLIVLYTVNELSYDRYNRNFDRIYRVNSELKYGETVSSFAIAAPPVAAGLKDNFPEVEQSARLTPAGNIRFKRGNESILEERAAYADTEIFDVFTLPLISGNPETALAEPNSVVINESIAYKYFNRKDVVGKTLIMAPDKSPRKITGVMRDMPSQSHFNYDLFLTFPESHSRYNSFAYSTYLLVKPGTDYKKLEAKFRPFIARSLNAPDFNNDEFEKGGNYIRINLTPLGDIHLKSNLQRELAPNGDIQYVYIFSIIALFILIIACINFINLSTARAATRSKEVGIRKVLGSTRIKLIGRFISESALMAIFASAAAIIAVWMLLPFFEQLAGIEVDFLASLSWLLPSLVIIIFIVGVLAGLYPALLLSSFRPANILKGELATGFKGSRMRNFLVVFQFSVSIFLIISTLVISGQLKFIQNKNIGFDRRQVLVINNAIAAKNLSTLKEEIRQLAGVKNATISSFLPTGAIRWPNAISSSPESAATKKNVQTEFWLVDEDYVNTLGMEIIQGRNFSSAFLSDSSSIIVNETAAKMLGYTGNKPQAVYNNNKAYNIIGIVKDFNFSSLKDNVTPLVMIMGQNWNMSLSVRVTADNLPALIRQIETKWRKFVPDQQMDYSFMDDDFSAMYRAEERMGKISLIFTSLAIAVACMGLLGLVTYVAEQRRKEISIRKVLGANLAIIMTLLSKDFLRLILIAFLVSSPIAWFATHRWLDNYAYQIDVQWWMFAAAGSFALLIAFITISFQSVKAALMNPVNSLRSE